MDNKKTVHQGEIFRLLIKRAKLRVEDVAIKMNVRPTSLSRSFASEVLTPKARRQAAEILGVDQSVFETGIDYEIPDLPSGRVGEPDEDLRFELERVLLENRELAERLAREEKINEDLRKVLMRISGASDD